MNPFDAARRPRLKLALLAASLVAVSHLWGGCSEMPRPDLSPTFAQDPRHLPMHNAKELFERHATRNY